MGRVAAVLLVSALVSGCQSQSSMATAEASASTSATGVQKDGLVLVNRSGRAISPATGFVVGACHEVFYDVPTLREIEAQMLADSKEGDVLPEGPDDGVGAGPAKLTVMFSPKRGLWHMLVSSSASPQLYFDPSVPSRLAGEAPGSLPKPEAWPPCEGQPRLGLNLGVGIGGGESAFTWLNR